MAFVERLMMPIAQMVAVVVALLGWRRSPSNPTVERDGPQLARPSL